MENRAYTPINPEHYRKGNIECIDAMISAKGIEKVKAFCDCNAFKYEWRVGEKDSIEQDVDKTIWYLKKLKELWRKTEKYRNKNDGSIVYLISKPLILDNNGQLINGIEYTDRKYTVVTTEYNFNRIFEKVADNVSKEATTENVEKILLKD
jgi:hypothetical protein